MREEYERDLHHAWMILETDELYKEDYQMRMLMENAIPGLLSVRGQGKDDKSQYRYEISGKISVKAKGEKEHWKFADLENFMRQFIQVLYAVKNYLLDVNCLSLDPGHIYVSDESITFVIVRDWKVIFWKSFMSLQSILSGRQIMNRKRQSIWHMNYIRLQWKKIIILSMRWSGYWRKRRMKWRVYSRRKKQDMICRRN